MITIGHHSLSPRTLLRLAVVFIIFLACSIGFVAVADEVHEGDTLVVDQTILTTINQQSTQGLDSFFVTFTELGGLIGVVAITAGILALLLLRKKYRAATIVAAGVGGAALINIILKAIFERPRPDLWDQLIVEHSFSFPSGHAMASSALAFSIIALFWNTRYRWFVVAGALLYILLIGLSRLYLGVHYPTDVLAGWLVSGAWVLSVVFAINGWRTVRRSRAAKEVV